LCAPIHGGNGSVEVRAPVARLMLAPRPAAAAAAALASLWGSQRRLARERPSRSLGRPSS